MSKLHSWTEEGDGTFPRAEQRVYIIISDYIQIVHFLYAPLQLRAGGPVLVVGNHRPNPNRNAHSVMTMMDTTP